MPVIPGPGNQEGSWGSLDSLASRKPCLKTVRNTAEVDLWALHAYARVPPSTYVYTQTHTEIFKTRNHLCPRLLNQLFIKEPPSLTVVLCLQRL